MGTLRLVTSLARPWVLLAACHDGPDNPLTCYRLWGWCYSNICGQALQIHILCTYCYIDHRWIVSIGVSYTCHCKTWRTRVGNIGPWPPLCFLILEIINALIGGCGGALDCISPINWWAVRAIASLIGINPSVFWVPSVKWLGLAFSMCWICVEQYYLHSNLAFACFCLIWSPSDLSFRSRCLPSDWLSHSIC